MKSLKFVVNIIFIIIIGCNSADDKQYISDRIAKLTYFQIPIEEFEIESYNRSSTMGDFIEVYVLKFTERQFDKVFSYMSELDNFEQINDSIYQLNYKFSVKEECILLFYPKNKIIKFTQVDI